MAKPQAEAAIPQRAAPKIWKEKEKSIAALSRKMDDFVH